MKRNICLITVLSLFGVVLSNHLSQNRTNVQGQLAQLTQDRSRNSITGRQNINNNINSIQSQNGNTINPQPVQNGIRTDTMRGRNRVNGLQNRNRVNNIASQRRLAINQRLSQTRNALNNRQRINTNTIAGRRRTNGLNGRTPSRNTLTDRTRSQGNAIDTPTSPLRDRLNSAQIRRRNEIGSRIPQGRSAINTQQTRNSLTTRQTSQRGRTTLQTSLTRSGLASRQAQLRAILNNRQTRLRNGVNGRTGLPANGRNGISASRLRTGGNIGTRSPTNSQANIGQTGQVNSIGTATRAGAQTSSIGNRQGNSINTATRIGTQTTGIGTRARIPRVRTNARRLNAGTNRRTLTRNDLGVLQTQQTGITASQGQNPGVRRTQVTQRSRQPVINGNRRLVSGNSIQSQVARNGGNGIQSQLTRTGANNVQPQTTRNGANNIRANRIQTQATRNGVRNIQTQVTRNRGNNIGSQTQTRVSVNTQITRNGNGQQETSRNGLNLQTFPQTGNRVNTLPVRNGNRIGINRNRNTNIGIGTGVNTASIQNSSATTNIQSNMVAATTDGQTDPDDLSNRVILTPVKDGAVESLRNMLQTRRRSGQMGTPRLIGFLIPRPGGRTQFQMMPDGRRFFSNEVRGNGQQNNMPFDLNTIVQAARRANLLPNGNTTEGNTGGRNQDNPSLVVVRPTLPPGDRLPQGRGAVDNTINNELTSSSPVDNNLIGGTPPTTPADLSNLQLNLQEASFMQNRNDRLGFGNDVTNNVISGAQPSDILDVKGIGGQNDLRTQISNAENLRPDLVPDGQPNSVAVVPLNQDPVAPVPFESSNSVQSLFNNAGNNIQSTQTQTDLLVSNRVTNSKQEISKPVDLLKSGGPTNLPSFPKLPVDTTNTLNTIGIGTQLPPVINSNASSNTVQVDNAGNTQVNNAPVTNIDKIIPSNIPPVTNIPLNNMKTIVPTNIPPLNPVPVSIVPQTQPTLPSLLQQTVLPNGLNSQSTNVNIQNNRMNTQFMLPMGNTGQQPIPIEIIPTGSPIQQTGFGKPELSILQNQFTGQDLGLTRLTQTGGSMNQDFSIQNPRPPMQPEVVFPSGQNQMQAGFGGLMSTNNFGPISNQNFVGGIGSIDATLPFNQQLPVNQIADQGANLNQFNTAGLGSDFERLRQILLREISNSQQQMVANNNLIDQSLADPFIQNNLNDPALTGQSQPNDLLRGLVEAISQGPSQINTLPQSNKIQGQTLESHPLIQKQTNTNHPLVTNTKSTVNIESAAVQPPTTIQNSTSNLSLQNEILNLLNTTSTVQSSNTITVQDIANALSLGNQGTITEASLLALLNQPPNVAVQNNTLPASNPVSNISNQLGTSTLVNSVNSVMPSINSAPTLAADPILPTANTNNKILPNLNASKIESLNLTTAKNISTKITPTVIPNVALPALTSNKVLKTPIVPILPGQPKAVEPLPPIIIKPDTGVVNTSSTKPQQPTSGGSVINPNAVVDGPLSIGIMAPVNSAAPTGNVKTEVPTVPSVPSILKTTPAAILKDTPPPILSSNTGSKSTLPTDPSVTSGTTLLTDPSVVTNNAGTKMGPTGAQADSTSQLQINKQINQLINRVISQDLSNAGLEQTLQMTGTDLKSMGSGFNSIGSGMNSMGSGLNSIGSGLNSIASSSKSMGSSPKSVKTGMDSINPADKTIASMSRDALKNLISEILKEFFSKRNVNQPKTGLNEPTIDSGIMAGTMAQAVIEAQALNNKQMKQHNQPDIISQLNNQAGIGSGSFSFNNVLPFEPSSGLSSVQQQQQQQPPPPPPMDILLQSMSSTGSFEGLPFSSGVDQLSSLNKEQTINQESFSKNQFSESQPTSQLTEAIFSASNSLSQPNNVFQFSNGKKPSASTRSGKTKNAVTKNATQGKTNDGTVITSQGLSPEFLGVDGILSPNSLPNANQKFPDFTFNDASFGSSQGQDFNSFDPGNQNMFPPDLTFPEQGPVVLPDSNTAIFDTSDLSSPVNGISEQQRPLFANSFDTGVQPDLLDPNIKLPITINTEAPPTVLETNNNFRSQETAFNIQDQSMNIKTTKSQPVSVNKRNNFTFVEKSNTNPQFSNNLNNVQITKETGGVLTQDQNTIPQAVPRELLNVLFSDTKSDAQFSFANTRQDVPSVQNRDIPFLDTMSQINKGSLDSPYTVSNLDTLSVSDKNSTPPPPPQPQTVPSPTTTTPMPFVGLSNISKFSTFGVLNEKFPNVFLESSTKPPIVPNVQINPNKSQKFPEVGPSPDMLANLFGRINFNRRTSDQSGQLSEFLTNSNRVVSSLEPVVPPVNVPTVTTAKAIEPLKSTTNINALSNTTSELAPGQSENIITATDVTSWNGVKPPKFSFMDPTPQKEPPNKIGTTQVLERNVNLPDRNKGLLDFTNTNRKNIKNVNQLVFNDGKFMNPYVDTPPSPVPTILKETNFNLNIGVNELSGNSFSIGDLLKRQNSVNDFVNLRPPPLPMVEKSVADIVKNSENKSTIAVDSPVNINVNAKITNDSKNSQTIFKNNLLNVPSLDIAISNQSSVPIVRSDSTTMENTTPSSGSNAMISNLFTTPSSSNVTSNSILDGVDYSYNINTIYINSSIVNTVSNASNTTKVTSLSSKDKTEKSSNIDIAVETTVKDTKAKTGIQSQPITVVTSDKTVIKSPDDVGGVYIPIVSNEPGGFVVKDERKNNISPARTTSGANSSGSVPIVTMSSSQNPGGLQVPSLRVPPQQSKPNTDVGIKNPPFIPGIPVKSSSDAGGIKVPMPPPPPPVFPQSMGNSVPKFPDAPNSRFPRTLFSIGPT